MKRDLLIWAAGFFDGEGCVSICKSIDKRAAKSGARLVYERYQMVAVIIQSKRAPLDVFVRLFGGQLRSQKAVNGSTYWKYKLHGRKATPMLERLLPYLIVKREITELGLRFESHLESTCPNPTVYRDEESLSVLRIYHAQAAILNKRHKFKNYVEEENNSALLQTKGESSAIH